METDHNSRNTDQPEKASTHGELPVSSLLFLFSSSQSANSLVIDGSRVGNAWFTGDVCHRLSAGLGEPHRLALTLIHRGLVDFLHDPCPSLSEYFLNFHSSTKLEEGGKIGERFL